MGRGAELSKEEKQVVESSNNLVPCSYCGRKFNEDAAKRHIPICEKKSKQMAVGKGKKRWWYEDDLS